VKRRVGAAASDIDEYGRGKNAMVQRILAAAELTENERASIDVNQVPSHDEVPNNIQRTKLPDLPRCVGSQPGAMPVGEP